MSIFWSVRAKTNVLESAELREACGSEAAMLLVVTLR